MKRQWMFMSSRDFWLSQWVANSFEIKFLFMFANMATRGSQFSQPLGMGGNIFRDMWNDNN